MNEKKKTNGEALGKKRTYGTVVIAIAGGTILTVYPIPLFVALFSVLGIFFLLNINKLIVKEGVKEDGEETKTVC